MSEDGSGMHPAEAFAAQLRARGWQGSYEEVPAPLGVPRSFGEFARGYGGRTSFLPAPELYTVDFTDHVAVPAGRIGVPIAAVWRRDERGHRVLVTADVTHDTETGLLTVTAAGAHILAWIAAV